MIWNLDIRCRILPKFAIAIEWLELKCVIAPKGLNEERNFNILHFK